MSVVVFDSGIGGLSIYNELREMMPDIHYIYAFDNEGFPYGNKSSEIIEKRITTFLNIIQKEHTIDLVVIACNTATTACLADLRNYYNFPIVGVVPAIKPAAQISRTHCIGLLATHATVNSKYTIKLIDRFAANSQIESLGLTELAVMAEKKLHGYPIDMQKLTQLMQPWLMSSLPFDTIVLGCTHYLFIKKELKQLFPTVTFVDSGNAVARRVVALSKYILLAKKNKDHPHNIAISTRFNSEINHLLPVLNAYQLLELQTIFLGFV